jgi:hypothetical protein
MPNDIRNNEVIKDSITVYEIQRISESNINSVSQRLLSAYPELLSLEINLCAETVKMVYSQPINQARLNQLINYFK